MVGIIGAIIGSVVGSLVTLGLILVGVAVNFVPSLPYGYLDPVILIPIVGVVLTTWMASWVGARRVLLVTPMQATGAALEESRDEAAGHRGRNRLAVVLFVFGTGLLVLAVIVGLVSPIGVLVGVFGGIISFTGLILGAELIMPPTLRMVGRMLGKSPPARLAAENAVRYPERSSRMTIGLVIGLVIREAYQPGLDPVAIVAYTSIGVAVGSGLGVLRHRSPMGGALLGGALGWILGAWGAADLGDGSSITSAIACLVPALLVGARLGNSRNPDYQARIRIDSRSRVVIFVGPALLFILGMLVIPAIRTA